MSADADEAEFRQRTQGNAFTIQPSECTGMQWMFLPDRREQHINIKQVRHGNSANASRSAASLIGWPSFPTEKPARFRILTDRKSTRLKSSHLVISYAVFCLKKKYIKLTLKHTQPYVSFSRAGAMHATGA